MRSACVYGSSLGLCWAQVVPMLGQVGPMLSHVFSFLVFDRFQYCSFCPPSMHQPRTRRTFPVAMLVCGLDHPQPPRSQKNTCFFSDSLFLGQVVRSIATLDPPMNIGMCIMKGGCKILGKPVSLWTRALWFKEEMASIYRVPPQKIEKFFQDVMSWKPTDEFWPYALKKPTDEFWPNPKSLFLLNLVDWKFT